MREASRMEWRTTNIKLLVIVARGLAQWRSMEVVWTPFEFFIECRSVCAGYLLFFYHVLHLDATKNCILARGLK